MHVMLLGVGYTDCETDQGTATQQSCAFSLRGSAWQEGQPVKGSPACNTEKQVMDNLSLFAFSRYSLVTSGPTLGRSPLGHVALGLLQCRRAEPN